MDKALEYLARNISKWPDGATCVYIIDYNVVFPKTGISFKLPEVSLSGDISPASSKGHSYTKDQIYAAKRELGLIVEEKQYVGPTIPVKALKEALDAIEDDLVIYALRTQLDYAEDEKILSHHEDDIKYNKKLKKALRMVLSHYGYVEEK